jgi:hypothetical protein
MRTGTRTVAFLTILWASSWTGRTAHAEAKDEARRHFDRAVELVDDGQLEGALVEFQRSYDLTHHFAVLYNIGQVLVSLARPVEAVDAYQRYLAEGRKLVPAARRSEVERELMRQKTRIATIEISGLPDGALVHVDGKEMGKAPLATSFRVAVGKHAITAAAEGYEPSSTELTVAGEDHRVLNLVLAKKTAPLPPLPALSPPSPAPASVLVATPPAASSSAPMSRLRIAGIVSTAVGLASLGAGCGFWFAAKDRHDDAMNVYQKDYPKAQGLQSDAEGFVTAANVSLVAGGALVALGVVSFIVGGPSNDGPGMHAYLLPSADPASAGLSVGGVW